MGDKMVTLFVSESKRFTLLEHGLKSNGIRYEVKLDDGRYGLDAPYLLVDGVPIDEMRAWKWIKDGDLSNLHK
jgi:hypothetical protein